jgi:radical SAM superfamily enzyme YgiQ (UPF0313 family)
MRICFVYPSYERHAQSNPEILDVVSTESYLGSPSASIPILAALTPEQHEVIFIDDRIEDVPVDEPFDLVALPVFTPAATRAMEIADAFRARGVKVVAGGIFSSLMPEEMASHVDAVCIGEGEPVWAAILADAERGELAPRYAAEEPYDLSRLPVPRFDLFFPKEGEGGYRSTGPLGQVTVDYALQLSRGCPLSCICCAIPEHMGPSIRFAEPDWVRACFEALSHEGGLRYVALTEDTLSLPTKRITRRFVAALAGCVDVGPAVSYTGASPMQALHAPAEYYEWLRRLHTVSIYMVFGFDELSRQAFAAPSDERAYQQCLDATQRVTDEGIGVYASLLVGHDEEDESVFDRILEFASRAELNTAEFVIRTPYPGTPLWHQLVAEERLITRDWRLYNDANPTYRPKNYSAERLREGYVYLWHQFYRGRPARHAIQI